MLIKNSASIRIPFLLVDATDDESSETGLSPSVDISKNGSAFTAATNVASEIGYGWYYTVLTATETNTDGPLVITASATGTDVWRDYHEIISASNLPVDVVSFQNNALTAAAIASSAFTNAKFATGAIGTDILGASALSASNIASGAFAVGKFGASAIGASNIGGSALDSTVFKSNAIGVGVLAASVLGASNIGGSAFDATVFKAGAIDAAAIAACAITDSEFAQSAADKVWSSATRTLTQGAASVTTAVSGSRLAIKRGDSWSSAITGLGSISNRSKLWFMVKSGMDNADADSIIAISEADGLLYFNGVAAASPTKGSLTVDNATSGNITLTLDEVMTASLAEKRGYFYDIQVLTTGGSVTTLSENRLDVTLDVTRAVS